MDPATKPFLPRACSPDVEDITPAMLEHLYVRVPFSWLGLRFAWNSVISQRDLMKLFALGWNGWWHVVVIALGCFWCLVLSFGSSLNASLNMPDLVMSGWKTPCLICCSTWSKLLKGEASTSRAYVSADFLPEAWWPSNNLSSGEKPALAHKASGVAFKECIVDSMGPNFFERSCLNHLPASVDATDRSVHLTSIPCAGAGKAGPSWCLPMDAWLIPLPWEKRDPKKVAQTPSRCN